MADEIDVEGRTIALSHRERVAFPEIGLTKGGLVDHYARSAHLLVRHAAGRPIALRRFPGGLDGQGFFQKNAGDHFPDWIRRVSVPKREGGALDHTVLSAPPDVVYLANQGTIELHPWTSTADDLEHPVEVLFDLDPPEDADVAEVRSAARVVRAVLEEVGVEPRLKTSGSKGYHVHVPLDGTRAFDDARQLADRVADLAAARDPDRLTTEWRRADRRGRVLLDVARNAYGQTSVAAYSVRARPTAPVAAPLRWAELERVGPRDVTVSSLFRRLGQVDDPWAGDVPSHDAADLLDRLT